jgi:hypothetical protein
VDPSENTTWDSDSGTWDSDTSVWDERYYNPTSQDLLIADPVGTKLYLADNTNQENGVNMTSYIERTGLGIAGQKKTGEPAIDLELIKHISGIYPKIDATNGTIVEVSVGIQQQIGDSVDWGTASNFTVGTDYKVDVRRSGRLIGVRFRTASDVSWRLTSYELDVDIAGAR